MATADHFTLHVGGAAQVESLFDALVEVYAEAYADRAAMGAPSAHPDAFAECLISASGAYDFTWAGAWADGELAGFGHGTVHRLGPWLGDALADRVRRRDRLSWRLFVTEELVVRPARRSQGIGGVLNMGLVKMGRNGEQAAGVRVPQGNEAASRFFRGFEYETLGLREGDGLDEPPVHVLVRWSWLRPFVFSPPPVGEWTYQVEW
ncbi:hypothetical protein ACWY4P_19670 [Streptomyces sp. LZ34]